MIRDPKRRCLFTFFICAILLHASFFVFASQQQFPQLDTHEPSITLNHDKENITYYAIVIGTNHQGGADQSTTLPFNETAEAFYQALLLGDNWKAKNICVLADEQATKHTIQTTIKDWLKPQEKKDDIIIFYLTGKTHIIPSAQQDNGNTYTLTSSCKDDSYSNETITDKELDQWLDSLDSDHITLILDTDYANKMKALRQHKRTVIGIRGEQYQDPLDQTTRNTGLFTDCLIKAFQRFTDRNDDEWISVRELFKNARLHCLNYSFNRIKDALHYGIFKFPIQLPFISDRHIGEMPLFSLSFGWKQLTDDGFGKSSNYATRGMEIFNGELYIGTQNNFLPTINRQKQEQILATTSLLYPDFYAWFGNLSHIPLRIVFHYATLASEGCEIWKYNFSTNSLYKVIGKQSISGISNGFDYHFNAAAAVLKEFKGYLYIGTWNTPLGSITQPTRKGCEVWRTADGLQWEQVVGHNAPYIKGGFGNPDNTGAWSIYEFNNTLYIGTMNWDFSDTGGCELWRSTDGLHWEQVVNHGFRPFMNTSDRKKDAVNTYAWEMQEYKGYLYLGTFNARLWLWDEEGTGGQLWRSPDGTNWEKVALPPGTSTGGPDGFGEGENYGIRRMIIYNDELYVGIASSFFHNHGCEIWKYDGKTWTAVIGDDASSDLSTPHLSDGFGDTMNKYIWSMVVTRDNTLWVGTANCQVYTPLLLKGSESHALFDSETRGCEIWCYNGTTWIPVITNMGGNKPNGLGDSANLGARSMIEYPKNSGNIVVGTFKLINPDPSKPREGCELWIRHDYNS